MQTRRALEVAAAASTTLSSTAPAASSVTPRRATTTTNSQLYSTNNNNSHSDSNRNSSLNLTAASSAHLESNAAFLASTTASPRTSITSAEKGPNVFTFTPTAASKQPSTTGIAEGNMATEDSGGSRGSGARRKLDLQCSAGEVVQVEIDDHFYPSNGNTPTSTGASADSAKGHNHPSGNTTANSSAARLFATIPTTTTTTTTSVTDRITDTLTSGDRTHSNLTFTTADEQAAEDEEAAAEAAVRAKTNKKSTTTTTTASEGVRQRTAEKGLEYVEDIRQGISENDDADAAAAIRRSATAAFEKDMEEFNECLARASTSSYSGRGGGSTGEIYLILSVLYLMICMLCML